MIEGKRHESGKRHGINSLSRILGICAGGHAKSEALVKNDLLYVLLCHFKCSQHMISPWLTIPIIKVYYIQFMCDDLHVSLLSHAMIIQRM